jgi:hypothetical protein
MREFIKKYWYDLLVCVIFAVIAAVGIAAMVQSLLPIDDAIENKRRIMEVFAGEAAKIRIEKEITAWYNIKSTFIWLYLAVIGFFVFMAAARILVMLNKRINKFALPVIGFINTVVLICAAKSAAVNLGDLGVIPGIVNAANRGQAPYFSPVFFIFILPLLFMGVLPLLSGIKGIFYHKKREKNVCVIMN